MDYNLYETEDFLADDSFLDYCAGRNESNLLFWRQWITLNTHKKAAFDEAVKLYSILNGNWTKDELDRNFNAFEHKFQMHISGSIEQNAVRKPRISKMVKIWLGSAAAVLFIGVLTIYRMNSTPSGSNSQQSAYLNDIAPGGNKATLTLASGEEISLSDARKGKIKRLPGLDIIKTAEGTVVYNVADNNAKQSTPEYNTIKTPKGGKYTINLPDGSTVTLNAASSLKFPSSFSRRAEGEERIVELNGEGYFQVAKNAGHPFVVKTASQQVRVLGTHFNINAYEDEAAVKTTLLEGRVLIRSFNKSNQEVTLKPGQQSTLQNRQLSVQTVNTSLATDWINGDFIFEEEPIPDVMRRIARWYDIEVQYEGQIPPETFTGKISRSNNISQVLAAMELTRAVHFKIEGRRVTLMGK